MEVAGTVQSTLLAVHKRCICFARTNDACSCRTRSSSSTKGIVLYAPSRRYFGCARACVGLQPILFKKSPAAFLPSRRAGPVWADWSVPLGVSRVLKNDVVTGERPSAGSICHRCVSPSYPRYHLYVWPHGNMGMNEHKLRAAVNHGQLNSRGVNEAAISNFSGSQVAIEFDAAFSLSLGFGATYFIVFANENAATSWKLEVLHNAKELTTPRISRLKLCSPHSFSSLQTPVVA